MKKMDFDKLVVSIRQASRIQRGEVKPSRAGPPVRAPSSGAGVIVSWPSAPVRLAGDRPAHCQQRMPGHSRDRSPGIIFHGRELKE